MELHMELELVVFLPALNEKPLGQSLQVLRKLESVDGLRG